MSQGGVFSGLNHSYTQAYSETPNDAEILHNVIWNQTPNRDTKRI